MQEKLTLETAIAHRIFDVAGKPEEKVRIFIGKPEQFGEHEWRCAYSIVGAG